MGRGIAIIAVALAAVAVSIWALDEIVEAAEPQAALLVFMNLVLLLIGILYRPEPRMPFLIDPIVLVCAFLIQFFVLAPIFMWIWGLQGSIYFRRPEPDSVVAALLAFFVMMALWILAYRFRVGVMLADMLPEFGPSRRKLPGRWIEMGLLAACVAASLWWVRLQGGLLAKLASDYGDRITPPLFNLSHKGLVTATLLIAWRVIDAEEPRRFDRILLGGVLAFDAFFYGILFGARKYLLFVFFGILTIWLLRRGYRTLPKLRTAAVMALLLIFFSAWGVLRGTPMVDLATGSDDPRRQDPQAFHMGYVTALTGPFGGACKVMEIFPEQEPFKYGGTLAVVALGFIPRAIWPDKPMGHGKEITVYYDGPMYKPSAAFSVGSTMVGGFWVDFGWVGVVAGGLLMGIVCRMITAYGVKGMRNGRQFRASRVLIVAVLVIGLGEVRSSLAAMLITWILQLAPLLLALTFFNLDTFESAREVDDAGRERRAPLRLPST